MLVPSEARPPRSSGCLDTRSPVLAFCERMGPAATLAALPTTDARARFSRACSHCGGLPCSRRRPLCGSEGGAGQRFAPHADVVDDASESGADPHATGAGVDAAADDARRFEDAVAIQ